jgi:DnaJ-class molecular chaperone
MEMDAYYRILGLNPGATKTEVKRAYRKLAMQLHPDRNPGPDAAEKFRQITEACDVLMGERKPVIRTRRKPSSSPSGDNARSSGRRTHNSAAHDRAAWIRNMRDILRKKREDEEKAYCAQVSAYRNSLSFRITIAIMALAALCGVLLAMDIALPKTPDTVYDAGASHDTEVYGSRRSKTESVVRIEHGGRTIVLHRSSTGAYKNGVILYESAIFKDLYAAGVPKKQHYSETNDPVRSWFFVAALMAGCLFIIPGRFYTTLFVLRKLLLIIYTVAPVFFLINQNRLFRLLDIM